MKTLDKDGAYTLGKLLIHGYTLSGNKYEAENVAQWAEKITGEKVSVKKDPDRVYFEIKFEVSHNERYSTLG